MLSQQITGRVRCSECQSPCELLKLNVKYNGSTDFSLYRCSEDDCGQYMLVCETSAIKLDQEKLAALIKENTSGQTTELERLIQRYNGQLANLRSSIKTIKTRIKKSQNEIDTISADNLFWQDLYTKEVG